MELNTKNIIEMAIEHRKSKEISFRKRCGEGILGDIARESGCSYPTLLNWKNGETEAKFSDLKAVINTCGLDFELKKRL